MNTFDVAPVARGDKTFIGRPLRNIGAMLSDKLKHDRDPIKCRFETGTSNHSLVETDSGIKNGFIDAVVTAYNHHLPLVLSPDDLWLLISLTVADIVGNNKRVAEKYRSTFVNHDGNKELIVVTAPRPVDELIKDKQHWNCFIDVISQTIAAETNNDISAIMTDPFSTTGVVEKAVMSITLMEAMKHYFSYNCMTLCGIPKVTLEGTVDDYESIVERLEKLKSILPDFFYFDLVLPHVRKIVESKKGSVDVDFWRKMVSLGMESGSGAPLHLAMNGWIVDFLQSYKTYGYDLRANRDRFALTMTPFKITDNAKDGNVYKMTFCGGFVGCSQDPTTMAVRPSIGWLLFFND